MLRTLCEKINIPQEHITVLENVDFSLQYIADLVRADVFIDCFYNEGKNAMVVAQAKPSSAASLYEGIIVGEEVLQEKEPAVYEAAKSRIYIQDIFAITQENKSVKQNIVPIFGTDDTVIGVLICEYDISESVLKDRKFKELAETVEQLAPRKGSVDFSYVQQKEIHHRVKNNLQIVASILNIQSRKVESDELRVSLKENVNRILSIALIHDMLTYQSTDMLLSVKKIIDNVIKNIFVCSLEKSSDIEVEISGDDVMVDSDKAVSIAIIINELVTNALKHAFQNRQNGLISVYIRKGCAYVSITVKDNGIGFSGQLQEEKQFGLGLVKMTVTDKLNGNLQVQSSESGTQITFDFENEV